MMGFGSGMMGGGFSIIFWIVIIGIVYYFFKEYNRNSHHNRRNGYRNDDTNFEDHGSFDDGKEINHRNEKNDAEEIARQRYAKGEISKEELREILDNLNS